MKGPGAPSCTTPTSACITLPEPRSQGPWPAEGWPSKMCREKRLFLSCLVQGIFFFLSCLFRHKPDLAGSQAVPCSIFASSCSVVPGTASPGWIPGLTPHAEGVNQMSRVCSVPRPLLPSSVPDCGPFRAPGGSGSCFFSSLPSYQGSHSPSLSLTESRAAFLDAGGSAFHSSVSCAQPSSRDRGASLEFQAITLSHRPDLNPESTGPEPPLCLEASPIHRTQADHPAP